jgi:hypothetical protein
MVSTWLPKKCPRCGQFMVRLSFYDPDGEIPLHYIVVDGEEWICTNPVCQAEQAEDENE